MTERLPTIEEYARAKKELEAKDMMFEHIEKVKDDDSLVLLKRKLSTREPECAACKRREEYPLRGVKLALDTLAAKKKRDGMMYQAINEILGNRDRIYPWIIKHDFLESDEPLGIMPQYALFEIQAADVETQISSWFYRLEHLVHWGKAVRPMFKVLYDLEDWMAQHFGDSTVLVHDGELAMSRLKKSVKDDIRTGAHRQAADKLNALLYMRFTTARAMTSMLQTSFRMSGNYFNDAIAAINTHRREKLDVKVEIDR